MDAKLKQGVVQDLKGALSMVGQAQTRIGATRAQAEQEGKDALNLWKELGELYDDIDSQIEEVEGL